MGELRLVDPAAAEVGLDEVVADARGGVEAAFTSSWVTSGISGCPDDVGTVVALFAHTPA